MKNKNKVVIIVAIIIFIVCVFQLIRVFAATTPTLGAAATYGVLAGTYTNLSAATTITGDVGFTIGPVQAPLGVHANYGTGDPVGTARTNAASALLALAAQDCTFNFVGGGIDLSTDGPNGATGVYGPGVYCSTGAMNVGAAGITLNGGGTHIFRSVGALTSSDLSTVTLGPATSACNIFWTPTMATTLGATTHFEGTVIDNGNAITVGSNTTWTGRALSLASGEVTTGDSDTITVPSCAPPTLTSVVFADAALKAGETSFVTFTFSEAVTDFTNDDLIAIENGTMTPVSSDDGGIVWTATFTPTTDTEEATNIVTLNLAGVVSVAGNAGIGMVNSDNYVIDTLRPLVPQATPDSGSFGDVKNVSFSSIGSSSIRYTVDGSSPSCSSGIIFSSALIISTPGSKNIKAVGCDMAGNISETASFTYTFFLSSFGNSNVEEYAETIAPLISLVDIPISFILPAIATTSVTVGVNASEPPLIAIINVPNRLVPFPFGGGFVTYAYTVTNPGTVVVHSVVVADDTCGSVTYTMGDTNDDGLLDPDEVWNYTCRMRVFVSTKSITTVTGEANGIVAISRAFATVLVAVPELPNTGLRI